MRSQYQKSATLRRCTRGLAWSAALIACLAGMGCHDSQQHAQQGFVEYLAAVNDTVTEQMAVDPALERLVKAYPSQLSHGEANALVWKDGRKMAWDDGIRDKTFEVLESDPDLQDMFTYPYPKGEAVFQENYDPGRIRNEAFFKQLYGASAREVEGKLRAVDWFGTKVKVTTVNGVDKALERVAAKLAGLPELKQYLVTPGGGYYWRVIAGTTRLSAHSFGIAVDINTAFTDYWRWGAEFRAGKPLAYRNRIPLAIVRIFEEEGFIWGGKWYHYDTMHFEYRPELL